jgi:hypothetical protein
LIAASDTALAAWRAAAAAGLTPRQAGKYPMMTVTAVGPPVKIGGSG